MSHGAISAFGDVIILPWNKVFSHCTWLATCNVDLVLSSGAKRAVVQLESLPDSMHTSDLPVGSTNVRLVLYAVIVWAAGAVLESRASPHLCTTVVSQPFRTSVPYLTGLCSNTNMIWDVPSPFGLFVHFIVFAFDFCLGSRYSEEHVYNGGFSTGALADKWYIEISYSTFFA